MPGNRRQEVKATVYDKRGRVLSIGYNSYERTHPKMKKFAEKAHYPHKEYLHAEVSALIKIRFGKPYHIKIERYDVKGNPKLAAPCPVCQLAIKEAGIKLITYTIG